MSTRCQVIVKDEYSEVWFYRHSDGYPEGTLPTLSMFLDWMAAGRIRDCAEQAAGWLVIIGNHEYREYSGGYPEPGKDWKVGAYEPCEPKKHGDIEFLYTIDCRALTVSVRSVNGFGATQKLGRSKLLYTAKRPAQSV